MRARIAASVALAVSLTTLLFPSPVGAATWTARVVKVLDGDTFTANVYGDSKGAITVRMAGLDTMELSRCHGAAAASLLRSYIGSRKVKLIATHAAPLAAKGRYLRYVDTFYDMPGPYERDVGAAILHRGLAVPYPSNIEPARNRLYKRIALGAQSRALRIWDRGPLTTSGAPSGSDRCGAGPHQDAPIEIVLRWDADGNDNDNQNDEWARIENHGDDPLPLDGWTLRDSAHITFSFRASAPGTVVPPHDWIKVHTGSGTANAHHLYWGRSGSIFGNATVDRKVMGDGAYLVDRDNDVRAFVEYPCLRSCAEPVGQSVDLSANYDGYGNDDHDPNREWINILNKGAAPIDLSGYVVQTYPYTYELAPATTLQPGERLRLYVGEGSDGPLVRYWGRRPRLDSSQSRLRAGSILGPDDAVTLGTYDGRTAVRFDWPAPDCPAASSVFTRQACPNPDVAIASVDYSTDALVLRNDTGGDIDLLDWHIQSWGEYSIDSHYVLAPSETVEIRPGDPASDGGGILHSTNLNLGAKIRLFTPYHAVADCVC
jgi:endonuclease YncB( thermonuclease family)